MSFYDDLVSDPASTYRQVLEFLDVDPDHKPEFSVVNANKVVRSTRVRDLLRHASPGLRRLGRVVVPDARARAHLRRRVHALNTRGRARPPMELDLRRHLTEEFAPEVRRLEDLLHRDLGAWLPPVGPGARRAPRDSGVASDRRAR